jgi:hypothetical protein
MESLLDSEFFRVVFGDCRGLVIVPAFALYSITARASQFISAPLSETFKSGISSESSLRAKEPNDSTSTVLFMSVTGYSAECQRVRVHVTSRMLISGWKEDQDSLDLTSSVFCYAKLGLFSFLHF